MNLTTPESVQKLQMTLHAKAKESPKLRFHALYDKVYRRDVLTYAHERCRANGGAAGVDDQTFEDIETYGVERWLDELTQELKSRTYQPQPVRRVYIPKPDGKQRPLGIPTIRDRVVQTAAVLILESIFEADLPPEQYAYRAERNALDAVRQVHQLINAGHQQIVDADLSSYFDNLDKSWLLKFVGHRVADRRILRLIQKWLNAGVMEEGKWSETSTGTPQGAVGIATTGKRLPALCFRSLGGSLAQEVRARRGGGGPLCGRSHRRIPISGGSRSFSGRLPGTAGEVWVGTSSGQDAPD